MRTKRAQGRARADCENLKEGRREEPWSCRKSQNRSGKGLQRQLIPPPNIKTTPHRPPQFSDVGPLLLSPLWNSRGRGQPLEGSLSIQPRTGQERAALGLRAMIGSPSHSPHILHTCVYAHTRTPPTENPYTDQPSLEGFCPGLWTRVSRSGRWLQRATRLQPELVQS